jgi:hypothetical protein
MIYTPDEIRVLKQYALGNCFLEVGPPLLLISEAGVVLNLIETIESVKECKARLEERLSFILQKDAADILRLQAANKIERLRADGWRERSITAEAKLTALKAYQIATKELLDEVE